jgi:hypothetical protein
MKTNWKSDKTFLVNDSHNCDITTHIPNGWLIILYQKGWLTDSHAMLND